MAEPVDDLIATLFPAAPSIVEGAAAPSPYHFQFTGEDNFQLETWNAATGVVVAVHGRMWVPGEGIRPFAFAHTPNTDRTLRSEFLYAGEGHLLNVAVFASSGTPRVGQTFVSLHVVRGTGNAVYRLATVVQGYVTRSQELAFPGSPVVTSEQGAGVIRTITGTDPAANVNWSETVPTGARWQILGVSARLVTAAGGADRQGLLVVSSGASTLGIFPIAATQPPSGSHLWYWWNGTPLDSLISGEAFLGGIPVDLILLAGETVSGYINNVGVGDDWQAPTLRVREWLEAA